MMHIKQENVNFENLSHEQINIPKWLPEIYSRQTSFNL